METSTGRPSGRKSKQSGSDSCRTISSDAPASSIAMISPAIQSLNQARQQYLNEVIEFNRAQFRLFTALGQAAECAVPATAEPLALPVLPVVK